MDGQLLRARILCYLPLLVAAIYLVVVTVPVLGIYGLWFDEIFSVEMSQDFSSVLRMVQTQENNMLLHYLLLRLWLPLGDGGEVFLRLSSLLLVLLSLLPLHAAARRLSNIAVANYSCLFYVSHYLVLQHAEVCRGYSLSLLMTSLLCWRWIVAWQNGKNRDWIIAGFLGGLAVWSHYFAALATPVLLFAMVWRDGLRQPWRQLCLSALAWVLAALPIFLTRPPDGAAQISWADIPTLYATQGTLWMLSGVDGGFEKPTLAILFAAVVFILFLRRQQWRAAHDWRNPVVGIAAGLLLTVLAVLLESFVGQPLFVPRFFTPLAPLYSVVIGAMLVLLWPWLRYSLLVAILATSFYETWRPFVTEPVPLRFWWKPMVLQVLQDLQPGDVILVYPSFLRMPVDYYLDYFSDRYDPQKKLPRPTEYASGYYRQGGGDEPEPDWQEIKRLTDSGARIWLLAEEKNNPNWRRLHRTHLPTIRSQLLQSRVPGYEKHYYSFSIQRFDMPRQHPDSAP